MMQVRELQQWHPYCGAGPPPSQWLERWNFDPLLLLAFVGFTAAWYLTAGRSRRAHAAPFAAGIGVLLLLFVSPFCALTSALFAARAAHHAILIAVAAPLLAWSLPGLKTGPRLPIVGWTVLQAIVLWIWHVPALYAAALGSDAVYWLMQISLLVSALLFWVSVRQAAVTAAVAALLATMVQMGLLGALITFAATPLYAPHLPTTAPWGLSPLEDQQLAGLIMWAPAAALYLAAALFLAGRWLHDEGRASA
jgi:putative membrane protein